MSEKDPFEYQPPTEATAPKYAAIRESEDATFRRLHGLLMTPTDLRVKAEAFAEVTRACRAFYDVIREHAPPSADRSAAERCVRLARMAANEAVALDHSHDSRQARIALDQLVMARWQACAAIALGPA